MPTDKQFQHVETLVGIILRRLLASQETKISRNGFEKELDLDYFKLPAGRIV